MGRLITDNFMLDSELARKLYNEVKDTPIYDYHSHLSPQEIYENKRFNSITEAWLGFDHYKWRQMRTCGIEEEKITGNASDYEKFEAYAKTLDYAFGNPLIHWTQLELNKYFNIDTFLGSDTAREVYNIASDVIKSGDCDVQTLITKSNVKMIGTTDDICDDLKWHKLIANDETIEVKVLPTFRPDRFINVDNENYLEVLEELSNITTPINNLDDFIKSYITRIDYFAKHGCKISDHGISEFKYVEPDARLANETFTKILSSERCSEFEYINLKSYLLELSASEYQKRNWTMQLHIGATRNNNAKLFDQLGADVGCDAIDDKPYIQDLSLFFKHQSELDNIGKTIVYNLNPSHNYAIATMIGSFQQGPTRGLLQFGSGWWFNDQRDGIEQHLKTHSQLGLLGVFIGMLTDSRSFLSFTRHDYFRRILCNYIATAVNKGEYPNDKERLSKLVKDICYRNAKNYFEL